MNRKTATVYLPLAMMFFTFAMVNDSTVSRVLAGIAGAGFLLAAALMYFSSDNGSDKSDE
ncbi:hypothetical protein [Corynebacterium massiliense]|uniref:hypothetical protein n=1 Tax=Corynebacterium massiliense TaxID=441501 RepID=UPI002354AF3B|nr:hypothetical protein [Corynebacterium massiliense]